MALLQISETRFYGEKVVWAMLGLIMPPLLAGFFTLIGLPLPFAIPTLGSLALAALFWFMPNYNAADDAKKARIEFNRALGAYIDMVATGVRDGSSGQQALRQAAEVGDTWVFKRIESEPAPRPLHDPRPLGLPARSGRRARRPRAWTTWPTSCSSPARTEPRSTTTSEPAQPHSARRCSAPRSARPTRPPSACTSPPACWASSSWRSSSPPRRSASPPDRPNTDPKNPGPQTATPEQEGRTPMLKALHRPPGWRR
ncbi:hypothetical protein [Nocardioides convexus]|uniref:type II secretion system F family protein n=1 Tax=Nocardioides convexus TaxID=2712224 RepID=UPI0024183E9A|nr:hypothetical protein [Nocardioides convexus]